MSNRDQTRRNCTLRRTDRQTDGDTSARVELRFAAKNFCAHQIAIDKAIILSTENVQKVYYRPKLENRCAKISQNALTGALFKQLPQAQIGPEFKNLFAQQIANDQTINLSL